MKKLIGLLAVLSLVVAACGGDEPVSLDTCEGVAEATIDLVQDVIDELEAMSPSDFGRMSQEGTANFPAFVEIEERGTELGLKAQELECADIDTLVAERADQLEADPANAFSQLIIESTRNGEDVMSRLFR